MSTESYKPSRLAIISILLPFVIVIVWCIFAISFGMFTETATNSADSETAGFAMLLLGAPLAAVITVLLSLAGVVIGIIALRKGDARRGLAIAGLIVNLLCLLPYLGFGILLLISAVGGNS